MSWAGRDVAGGLDALRVAVADLLLADRVALAGGAQVLFSEALADGPGAPLGGPDGFGDADQATSSEESEAERTRLIALVELARTGDSEAFGLLYDHYQASV